MRSRSASSIDAGRRPARTIRDVGSRPRARASSEKPSSSLGAFSSAPATSQPRGAETRTPSTSSCLSARRSVTRLTSRRWHSSRSGGKRSPGVSAPLPSSAASWSYTFWYSGRELRERMSATGSRYTSAQGGATVGSHVGISRFSLVCSPRCLPATGSRPCLVEFDIIAALLTPFTAAGGIDVPALRAHLRRLADAGIDGVMTAGTTGEGPLLTDAETLTVLGEAIAAVGGRLRVYAHVGRIGTQATADLAQRSVALGADAVTAVCPFYYAVSPGRPRRPLPGAGRRGAADARLCVQHPPLPPATTSRSTRCASWPTRGCAGSRTRRATPTATAS